MSEPLRKTLEIHGAPHLDAGARVDAVMRHVIVALLPATAFGCYAFGWSALLVLVTAMASCMLTEAALSRALAQPGSLRDHSALVTGLIYGLTLPPQLPLWMVALGGVVAIAVGKALFGGLGYNVFNPALVGRAFLQAAFPAAMTTWAAVVAPERWSALAASTLAAPFARPVYDGVSAATPLALQKFEQQSSATGDLLLGFVSGSIGETSAVLLLLGGVYLVAREVIDWRTPLSLLATVALCAALLHALDAQHATPPFWLYSGGLMLGAFFMTTDPVASPLLPRGRVLYGVVIGALVVVMRTWSGMPEGVMYAILLGNAISPLLDRWTQPRVYGT